MRGAVFLLSGLLGLGIGAPGCSVSQDYNQCQKDADCQPVGGTKRFCTGDHLCVAGTPADKLCTKMYPAQPSAGAVPVGVLAQLATDLGGTDTLLLSAIELAVDEVNTYAGAGQRPIVLHICDTTATDDDALKAMEILTRERNVVAVIGPTSSREVIAVAVEAGRAGVPLVSPSATASAISDLPQKGLIFRTAPSDNLQGPVLSHLVIKNGAKLALVFVDDAYGTGLSGAFVSGWAKGGVQNTPSFNRAVKEGDKAAVAKAVSDVLALPSLDYVVAIVSLDAAPLLEGWRNLPFTTQILMTDGAKSDTLLALITEPNAPPAMHFTRVHGTSPTVSLSSSAYVTFQLAFSAKYNGMSPSSDPFTAYGYDCLYGVAVALGNARGGEVTGPVVAAGLARISGGDSLTPVGRASYLSAVQKMAAGKNVPLDGASGPVRFTVTGDRDQALFEEWGIDVDKKMFTSTPAN